MAKTRKKVCPADVAMVWGTMLEKGVDVKAPELFTNSEKYGFTKQESDNIRRWADLQPLARKFKSEGLKRMNEAMAELYAMGNGADPQREYELETIVYRERVENKYANVWLLNIEGGYNCCLIDGTYEECKAWVAENHLEEITDISYDPKFLEWQLDYHLNKEKPSL